MAKRSAAPALDSEPVSETPEMEDTATAASELESATPDLSSSGDGAAPAEVSTPAPDPLRTAFESAGFGDLPEQFDASAAAQRLQELRNRQMAAEQSYTDMARRMAAFEQAQRRQPQAEQKPADPWWKKSWNPPDVSESLINQWVEDGAFKPDTPLEVRQKIVDYLQYRKDWNSKFSSNPIQTIYDGIKDQILNDVRSVSQEAVGGYEMQQWAQGTIHQISNWAFALNPDGSVALDASNKPVRTPDGQRYAGYLVQAYNAGVQDPRAQHQYALSLMDRDYYAAMAAGKQGASTSPDVAAANDAAKQQAQRRRNGHSPNRSGTLAAAFNTPDPVSQNPSQAIGEMLETAFAEAGLN